MSGSSFDVIMRLVPFDPTVLTHEQGIIFHFCKLIAEKTRLNLDLRLTESEGYYASQQISVQQVNTVDAGPCHVFRIVIPVRENFYGAASSVWTFADEVIENLGGLDGFYIPTTFTKVRLNADISGGVVQYRLPSKIWVNYGTLTAITAAFIGPAITLYAMSAGAYYKFISGTSTSWVSILLAEYNTASQSSQSIIL